MNRFLVLLPLPQIKFGKRLSFKWPENVSIFWEISVWTSRSAFWLTSESLKAYWREDLVDMLSFWSQGKESLECIWHIGKLAKRKYQSTEFDNTISRSNYWQKRRERRRRGAGEGLPYFFIWTDPKIKQPLARHWCQNSALPLNDIVQYRKKMCTQWLYCY